MKVLLRGILILSLLLVIMVCGLWTISYADIPRFLNYQGKLTDQQNKPVIDGTYSVTFMIYEVETAGIPLWTETQQVNVSKGIFSVLLGGVTNLNLSFDKPYWLELKVQNEVMSPRQRIASAAYAMRAEVANNADKVANVEVSTTSQPNKILPLDASGKLPISALKVYDSGWLAGLGVRGGINLTHNLGTTKVLWTLLTSKYSDGANPNLACFQTDAANELGVALINITAATCRVQVADNTAYTSFTNTGGTDTATTVYCRVIALALE